MHPPHTLKTDRGRGGSGEALHTKGEVLIPCAAQDSPGLQGSYFKDFEDKAKKSTSEDSASTVSSLAESIHIETASSSNSDSFDTQESGKNQDPHRKNGHSAHTGVPFP